MSVDGLRERKGKEQGNEANGHAKPPAEPEKSDKTYGRTPDGTGRLTTSTIFTRRFSCSGIIFRP